VQTAAPVEAGVGCDNRPPLTVKQFLDGNVNLSAWLVAATSLAFYMSTIPDRLFGLLVAAGAVGVAFIVALELWDQLYEKVPDPMRMAGLRRLVAVSPIFLMAYAHLRYRAVTHDILYAEVGVGVMLALGLLRARKRLDARLDGKVRKERLRGLLRGLVIVASSVVFIPIAYGLNLLLDRLAPYGYWTGLLLTTIYSMFCLHLVASLLIAKLAPHINKIHGE
jgi:hypothetical protein